MKTATAEAPGEDRAQGDLTLVLTGVVSVLGTAAVVLFRALFWPYHTERRRNHRPRRR